MSLSSPSKIVRFDPPHERGFDEQLWPINLVILILAALATGFVVATSEFPDPQTLDLSDPAVIQTGWGRLVAVAITALAAITAVLLLQRWMARRVLFCLLLGLIVHLWLGLYLHEQYIEAMAERAEEERALLAEEEELTVVPDYHVTQISPTDEPQSFERPVEAEPPRESQPLEVEKKAKSHEVVAERPAPVPQTLPDEAPTPLRLDRAESSVPLQADRAAGIELSRQATPDRPEHKEPIAQPETPPTAAAPSPRLASQPAPAQRRIEQSPPPEPTVRRLENPRTSPAHLDRRPFDSAPAASQSAPRPVAKQVRPLESESSNLALPSVPTTRRAAQPDARPDRAASQVARSNTPAVAPQRATGPDSPSPSPNKVIPQNRRDTLAPSAAELTGQADRRVSRAESPGRKINLSAMPPQSSAPAEIAQGEPSRTIDAAEASRVPQRSVSPGGAVANASRRSGQPSALPAAEVSARIGRPRPHAGERPALESGGAGNPLSRSRPALPTTPSDLPSANQIAATGTGSGTRPDTRVDAAVAGPTRRTPGTTTELAIGRTSTAPPPGTIWGDDAEPVPIRRATTTERELAPTGTSGGGRDRLARSAFASDAADIAARHPAPTPGEPRQLASQAASVARPIGDPEGTGSASPTSPDTGESSTGLARSESLGPAGRLAGANGDEGSSRRAGGTDPGPAAIASRRGPRGDSMEPRLAMSSASVPRRRIGAPGGPDLDMPLTIDAPSAGQSRDQVQRPSEGPVSSQAERRQAGPSVPIRQAEGPGGLSDELSPELGIPNRRARPESVVVHTTPGRFMLDRAAGRPPFDASMVKPPAAAFRQRFPGARNDAARKHGATDSSDRAVEQGLYFLSRCQFPDGRWALDRLPPGVVDSSVDAGLAQMNSDTAATGLALLAFLGKGYTHVDYKYRNQVSAGLRWLIANQQEDGRLFNDRTDQTLYAQFYAHGIATIALGEAYGMTWDEDLRGPLQRAIGFTLDAQHPQRGAWRYRPRQESDTSVSGWHLMALKSAQMAGVEIPSQSLAGVSGWLDLAQGEDGSRYRYNPYALDNPSQRQGRLPSLAMTAEGLLMRLYLGRHRTHQEMVKGANYLGEHLPGADGTPRDVYYLYYATQVMFQMQGDYWETWNDHLRPLLESTQVQKGQLIGSWSPTEPSPDRWGHAGGRLYMTAMNLLMLEVYYRHMPLFRELEE